MILNYTFGFWGAEWGNTRVRLHRNFKINHSTRMRDVGVTCVHVRTLCARVYVVCVRMCAYVREFFHRKMPINATNETIVKIR
jgi:hypothetical protein